MNTTIKTITPHKAKELLRANTKNRPLQEKRINYYAKLMRDGKWSLTHQGIAIADSGLIIDGQHRLHAIVRANMPIDVHVTTGVSEDSFKYIDVGYARSTGNIFAIEDIKNYTRHASGVTKYFTLKSKSVHSTTDNRSKIERAETHDDYLQFYFENEELLINIQSQCASYYGMYRILKHSTLYSYFTYLIIDKGHTFNKVKNFFDNVYLVSNDSKSNAPRELFNRLISDLTGATKLKNTHKSALVNKAWNMHVAGKSIKRFYYNEDNEKFPNLK